MPRAAVTPQEDPHPVPYGYPYGSGSAIQGQDEGPSTIVISDLPQGSTTASVRALFDQYLRPDHDGELITQVIILADTTGGAMAQFEIRIRAAAAWIALRINGKTLPGLTQPVHIILVPSPAQRAAEAEAEATWDPSAADAAQAIADDRAARLAPSSDSAIGEFRKREFARGA